MFVMEIVRLIERCRQGDAEAFGELYEAYAHRMRGVCRRYVSDKQTVEDVVHDAFVIIFTSFDRLRDPRRAESWMMAIARNVASKCKDHLDTLPTIPLEETDGAELLAAEDDGVCLSSEEKDVKGVPLSEVIGLIDKLPEGYGQVFRLSVFEGMTHKEIAAMLDIEPHSSSSQLSRAKKMLRKMMQQYWVLLLLLFVPLTLYLFKKAFDNEDHSSPAIIGKKPIVAKPESQPGQSPTGQSHKPVIIARPTPLADTTVSDTLQLMITQAADSTMLDTLSNMTAQEHTISDTVKYKELTDTVQTIRKMEMPHHEITNWIPERTVTGHTPKWSVELAYAGQLDKWNRYNQSYTYKPKPLPGQSDPGTSPTIPSSIDNWSDYAVYLANNPDAASEQTRSVIMRIALNNANRPGEDKILRTSHHQMPITWSLSLKYKLNHRWGLETGLNYSKLNSEFKMGEDGNKIEQQQAIHYLGIPVKGLFNIYGGKTWSLYGSACLMTEIPVYAPLYSNYYVNGMYETGEKTTIRAPWQFSTTFGLGMQYHLTPSIGIFAEPSLQYFIPTHTDIETYRTEHPFTFSLPLGIRFTW